MSTIRTMYAAKDIIETTKNTVECLLCEEPVTEWETLERRPSWAHFVNIAKATLSESKTSE